MRRPRRNRRPLVELLDGRLLMSRGDGLPANGDLAVSLQRLRLARAEALPHAAIAPAADTDDPDKDKPKKEDNKLKATSIAIYGTLLPASIVTDGKKRGAAVVSGGVVWLLDLTAFRGYDAYAQQLLQKPVVVWGTTEIKRAKDGDGLERKIQVGWMEPLKDNTPAPPLVPITQVNGRPRIIPDRPAWNLPKTPKS